MFHRIMVAYDESVEASKALDASIKLANALGAELSIVTVIEPLPAYFSWAVSAVPVIQWSREKRMKYTSLQTSARQKAKAAGLWLDAELINGDEVDCIIECARKYRADLLILGMPRHALLIGHTAKEIAERSPCALMGIR